MEEERQQLAEGSWRMEIQAGCGLFRPPLPANPWWGDYTAAASISASTHRLWLPRARSQP